LADEIGTTEENILTFDLCYAEWNDGNIFGL